MSRSSTSRQAPRIDRLRATSGRLRWPTWSSGSRRRRGRRTARFARSPAATCPGKVVGQFRYTGTRPDDPNDIYPHERRRELRGLRVFAAWLNHDDARSINSIDTYVEEGGRHYIRHYLQDFGSNLGSGSTSAQQPRGGNEYLIEGDKIAKGLFSFGLLTADWAKVRIRTTRRSATSKPTSSSRGNGRPSIRSRRSTRWMPPTLSGRQHRLAVHR